MSTYRFSPDSPVASVTFHYAEGAPTVALIEASQTASAAQVDAAKVALSQNGMNAVAVTVDGKDKLQVSGFATEQTLIDALTANESVIGTPKITQEAGDFSPPKSGFKTFLKNYSFRLAGGLNLIGDIAMHAGGYGKITARIDESTGKPLTAAARKESVTSGIYELTGGGLYTLGGLNSLVFGNSKSQAVPLANRTTNFIAHTIDPQSTALSTPKTSENFLRRHTADTTLAAYTLGAGTFLTDGLRGYNKLGKELLTASAAEAVKLKERRKESSSLMAYGASSLLFKLLSLFIKEKPKTDDDKPKSSNPIVRVKDWFVEKPLRIFGIGSLITDSLYAKYAYDTYKRVKGTPNAKSKGEYMFKIVTTFSYFASDFLSAISSKNPLSKTLDADGERGVIAVAAQSIAEQPEEKREALVSKTAQFLGDQPEMQRSGKTSIASSLRSQLGHLASNPWAKRVETSEPVLQKQR